MIKKFLKNRQSAGYSDLIQIIHPKYVDDLLSGKIKRDDIVETKCPLCHNYGEHKFHDLFRIASNTLKYNHALLCSDCQKEKTSHYEIEIANYISSFCNNECIKNDRSVINGKELDLYYPEKKIAIEFNGDYWHSDAHKSDGYHYNKFIECYNRGITLISIFESEWNSSKELIKSYIKDLFSGVENQLSYKTESVINLNYPPIKFEISQCHVEKDFYSIGHRKVYTCGYAIKKESVNQLDFLADLAKENNLDYFINSKNDLEIRNKNICFHLADMLSGEFDSYNRWKSYHNNGIRCVFIYPPDLDSRYKINIYKNILLYHCGLAKRIYARNTEVKVYPAIKMKQFFNENNIAGYRNSKTAYVLEDKKTHEPLMCYLIGHSYFGKGNYDCEIARGACKMGISVTGGASKLWKHIISDNPDIKSIVYYCDRRQYDQRSISHLMDSDAMKGLGTVYTFNGAPSFMNYWINDVYIGENIWHRAGEFKNREPSKHKYVMEAIHNGDCISVYNPGSFTNIFVRTGYHLDGLKVVQD